MSSTSFALRSFDARAANVVLSNQALAIAKWARKSVDSLAGLLLGLSIVATKY